MKHYWIVGLIIFLPFIAGSFLYVRAQSDKKIYISKLKNKIYTKLFKVIGLEYKRSVSPDFADYQNAVLKHITNKRFISKDKSIDIKFWSYIMQFEDGIQGTFKDISFELCDAKITRRYETKYHDEQIIFQGIMLAVKLNKNFDKETVIKTDNFNLFNIKKNLVKLEDEEFNKKFKVLADDEVEARYLLTTSFMERLKDFHKNKKDKTIIFFDNSSSESKNMYILTNTGKDNFEIPFNKSILNEKLYYNLLKELVDMLEIAVALKLEQNIGL